jgi:hypothetical protein
MAWRFRRRIGLLPGFRLNVGKRGVSLSAGVRGLHTTIGRRISTTAGLPGTGLSYTTRGASQQPRPPHIGLGLVVLALLGWWLLS